MTMELQDPAVWLNEQMKRQKLSQNEVARKAGIASSTLTQFSAGKAGEEAAVKIANFFNVPTQLTLAMMGLAPPPPTYASAEAQSLCLIYDRLDDERRVQLVSFARFLTV